jgi:hypothetical protein
MAWFGKGKYIGTDRDRDIDRNINNAYGVWSVNTVKDYAQNYKWAFPAIAIGATGGSISTVTVGSTSYRIHQFDSTSSFTILTGSTEPFTIECLGAGGNPGNAVSYSVSNEGCGGGASNAGGAGGGASVIVGTGIQLTSGVYSVYVGDSTNGSSLVNNQNNTIIRSSNGGAGGNATGTPGSGISGSPGSGGIAGTTFISTGISTIYTASPASGGAGGLTYYCDMDQNYRGGNGGNPGYIALIPALPAIPSDFQIYSGAVGPSLPGTRNRGLGNLAGGGVSPNSPAPYGPGPDSNASATGGSRGGIVRIIYKFIQ